MSRLRPYCACAAIALASVLSAPGTALAGDKPVARYHLENAWPKAPAGDALSDMPAPPNAAPRERRPSSAHVAISLGNGQSTERNPSYDYPGGYAGRFDGIGKGNGAAKHSQDRFLGTPGPPNKTPQPKINLKPR